MAEAMTAVIAEALQQAIRNTGQQELPQKAAVLAILRQKAMLTPKEVQELYGLNANTLNCWRSDGRGPVYHKAESGVILYSHEDIKIYLRNNRKLTNGQ